MSYSLPSPPKTHILLGAGYTYGVGCGVGPFFGLGVALTPLISFGAGAGVGAFCGVGFAAGVVGSCGSGSVTGLSTSLFYLPRMRFLEQPHFADTKRNAGAVAGRVLRRFVAESRAVVTGLGRFFGLAGKPVPGKQQ